MMRSPYQTPKKPPSRRFLRLPPPEKKRRKRQLLLWGAGLLLGYLAYSFVGGETGLVRIRSLHPHHFHQSRHPCLNRRHHLFLLQSGPIPTYSIHRRPRYRLCLNRRPRLDHLHLRLPDPLRARACPQPPESVAASSVDLPTSP